MSSAIEKLAAIRQLAVHNKLNPHDVLFIIDEDHCISCQYLDQYGGDEPCADCNIDNDMWELSRIEKQYNN